MWWERWIPESYMTKQTVIGVECILDDINTVYNYTVLKKNKQKLDVADSGTTDVVTILEKSKKLSAPISLIINGKGVITKKIVFSENDSLALADLIKQHLPAINASEFYIQFYKNNNYSGHLAVCRKETANAIINPFVTGKTECVNVFFGPLVINSLSSLSAGYNRLNTTLYSIQLVNGEVDAIHNSGTDNTQLQIEDLLISTLQLAGFAAGFAYFTHQELYESTNEEIATLPEKHTEKIKLKLLVFTLIAVLFLISGVNSVVFFQKFEAHQNLETELNLYESKNSQITGLLDNYQRKKKLIEQAGILENKRTALYADKIAASLPSEIVLRELYFNPEDGETEEDSLMNFINDVLIIKGNCNKSLLLNEWVNVLKSQQFIKSVNLENFIFHSEGHQPNFVLKIETR